MTSIVNSCVFLVILTALFAVNITDAAFTPTPFLGNTMIGMYAANSKGLIANYSQWLGRNVSLASVHTGEASQSDYLGSIDYCIKANGWGGDQAVSLPLFWAGCTLANAAAGAYNSTYLQAAKNLVGALPTQPIVYIRIGWEQNIPGQKWAATNASTNADYIKSFRVLVDILRTQDPNKRFRFVWCPNIGGYDPNNTYPGDNYVDVIGMDFYYNAIYNMPSDPVAAFNYQKTFNFGLNWLTSFAASHGKRSAIPEWGINVDGFGAYVQGMADWCYQNNVLYINYWETNAAYPGQLQFGQYPETGAAYRTIFGKNNTVAATTNALSTGSATTGATRPATTGAVRPATTGAVRPATTGAVRPATTGSTRPATTGAVRPATTGAVPPATTGGSPSLTTSVRSSMTTGASLVAPSTTGTQSTSNAQSVVTTSQSSPTTQSVSTTGRSTTSGQSAAIASVSNASIVAPFCALMVAILSLL